MHSLCKVASIGFYSPFHFVLHWFDNLFAFLYFSTMHILWDRQSQYDVLLFKSLVYDSWLLTSKTSYWDCWSHRICIVEKYKNGEMVSKTQYSPLCKVASIGFYSPLWVLHGIPNLHNDFLVKSVTTKIESNFQQCIIQSGLNKHVHLLIDKVEKI